MALLQASLRVPTINLALPEEEVAAALYKACAQYGFFYLKNHGVPKELVAATMQAQRDFFALQLERKMGVLLNSNNRGYTPLGQWRLDPTNSRVPDTHEGLYFGREVAAGSEEAKLPLHGPNQWPSEEVLPGYRATVERYFDAAGALAMRTCRLVALSLGLPAEYFNSNCTRPIFTLRPLHYSKTKSNPQEGAFGIGAHADYGMLTFLLTDDVPGLQVCPDRKKMVWVDVPPQEGCYIVKVGDMLHRWTNGVFRSSLHRVVNSSGCEHYSLPFFFGPNFDALVEPLPQRCVDSPPKFPPITCGQHLLDKLATTYAGPDKRDLHVDAMYTLHYTIFRK